MWSHPPRGAGGGARGGGDAPRMSKLSGTEWPRSDPTTEPGPSRTEGAEGSPQVAGRGGDGSARRGGSTPRRILTTRGGRAAQPERQQHPQPSRAQGGHLLDRLLRRRRHRRGRSTWGGGPDRGAPTFSPPSSCFCGSQRHAAPRNSGSTPCTPSPPSPFPGRRLSRRPKFGCNFLGCAAKQPRVSFRLGRLLPPQAPPPVASRRLGTQGFPAGRSAGRAARGGICWELPDTPAAPGPRRGPARPSERHGRGGARRARPLPEADAAPPTRGLPRP